MSAEFFTNACAPHASLLFVPELEGIRSFQRYFELAFGYMLFGEVLSADRLNRTLSSVDNPTHDALFVLYWTNAQRRSLFSLSETKQTT